MWKFTDYLWFSIFILIDVVEGTWEGLSQIPTYVSARIRTSKTMINEIVKTRETGNTPRERRIQALRNNRRNDQTDS
jgi:hypothetical protein